jgi:hypothetical protein
MGLRLFLSDLLESGQKSISAHYAGLRRLRFSFFADKPEPPCASESTLRSVCLLHADVRRQACDSSHERAFETRVVRVAAGLRDQGLVAQLVRARA